MTLINKETLSRSGLRRFIVIWSGLILAAFVALCVGQVWLVARLHEQTNRIVFDAESLRASGAFEAAVLSQSLAQNGSIAPVQNADESPQILLDQLKASAGSALEMQLIQRVSDLYARWQKPHATRASLHELLDAVRAHRRFNANQLLATQQRAERIDTWVDRVSFGLIFITSALVLLGAVELWTRVFRPVQDLAQATRAIGQGDWSTRVAVRREDEMGQLARTFNNMAQSMGDREKERLEFVATVAHDLKNPLMVIGGAAHLLARKDMNWTHEDRLEWLERISNQATKLEALIGDLTDGVQSQTGQLHLQQGALDFPILIQEAIADHQETSKHQLIYQGPSHLELCGDARRLERVVFNLLSNAIKYSPSSREVRVLLQSENGMAHLQIRDEGAGIAPEDLPLLFRPFTRLENTRHMAKGTGLGLSSVKKIIEAHGGTIHVRSEINKGTTVEVLLPLPVPDMENSEKGTLETEKLETAKMEFEKPQAIAAPEFMNAYRSND